MPAKGGGGTALSALTPYQVNTHLSLLGGGIGHATIGTSSFLADGVIDYLEDALAGGNPFSAAFAYDPANDLSDMQGAFDAFNALVSALNPETDFTSFLAQGLIGVDTLMDDTYIDSAVDAFETRTAAQFARSINRITGPMSDIGAVNSSAFVIAMTQAENARQAELNTYRATLDSQQQRERVQLAAQFASDMSKMLTQKLEATRAAATLQSDISKNKIIAGKEYLAEDLELDYKDVTYELELFGYGNAALAAGLGASSYPVGPSKASTALSSAISAGTTIGSLAGQISPALGALGFVGGGLATYLTNMK